MSYQKIPIFIFCFCAREYMKPGNMLVIFLLIMNYSFINKESICIIWGLACWYEVIVMPVNK